MKFIVSLIWINMTQHALVCLFIWVNHYSWRWQEYPLSELTLTTSSSVDWHCTASDTSVTVPSVPTVTTFTGTATVFPFSTAVFRISVSCDTHKKCLNVLTDSIPSVFDWFSPSFLHLCFDSFCLFFFISSVIHSFIRSLFFPYYNCSYIGLVIPIFISFFILTSLIHCWFYLFFSSFHQSSLLPFFTLTFLLSIHLFVLSLTPFFFPSTHHLFIGSVLRFIHSYSLLYWFYPSFHNLFFYLFFPSIIYSSSFPHSFFSLFIQSFLLSILPTNHLSFMYSFSLSYISLFIHPFFVFLSIICFPSFLSCYPLFSLSFFYSFFYPLLFLHPPTQPSFIGSVLLFLKSSFLLSWFHPTLSIHH